MRWLRLPRFNAKREIWPGGPQVGQVIDAQLNPPTNARAAAARPADAEDGEGHADGNTRAVQLLLLLR